MSDVRGVRAGGYAEDVWLVRASTKVPAGAEPIDGDSASRLLAVWFPDDGRSLYALFDAAALAGYQTPHKPDRAAQRAREVVTAALRDGKLVAFRLREQLKGGPLPHKEDEGDEPQGPNEEKTFVAIRLVDDSDPPRPVPFERYRVELPDHSVREGQLDQNGQAFIAGIDEGTCKVSFPRLRAQDWKLK